MTNRYEKSKWITSQKNIEQKGNMMAKKRRTSLPLSVLKKMSAEKDLSLLISMHRIKKLPLNKILITETDAMPLAKKVEELIEGGFGHYELSNAIKSAKTEKSINNLFPMAIEFLNCHCPDTHQVEFKKTGIGLYKIP